MKTERWAFTKSELDNPAECCGHDELIANVPNGDNEIVAVIVYRNGTVSNRFADGIAGIGTELADAADAEDDLYNPKTDELTAGWRDVLVDGDKWKGWAKDADRE